MSRVPKEFIKSLQGKDFVLLAGLLELAHQDGLKSTDTQIIQFPSPDNQQTTIVKAVVVTEKGSFSGIGDASPASVPNKAIAVHSIRMAETRALARALRVATNVAMTAFEELGGDVADDKPQQRQRTPEQQPQQFTEPQKAVLKAAKKLNWGKQALDWFMQDHGLAFDTLTAEQADMAQVVMGQQKPKAKVLSEAETAAVVAEAQAAGV